MECFAPLSRERGGVELATLGVSQEREKLELTPGPSLEKEG